MDGLEFTAEVLKAAAWPGAVVAVAVMFKEDIKKLLGKLKSLEGPAGTKAAFEQDVQEVAAQSAVIPPPEAVQNAIPAPADGQPPLTPLGNSRKDDPGRFTIDDLAADRPAALVLDSWRNVEMRLWELSRVLRFPATKQVRRLIEGLVSKGYLDSNWQKVITDLFALRNKVAHIEFEPDRESAIKYYESTKRVIDLLDLVREQQEEFRKIGDGIESP